MLDFLGLEIAGRFCLKWLANRMGKCQQLKQFGSATFDSRRPETIVEFYSIDLNCI